MAELPGFLGIHEVIGVPGQGYERPDDPSLPYVLLSGDELLHLNALASPRVLRREVALDHPTDPYGPDTRCPLCDALWGEAGKVPALLQAAGDSKGGGKR